MGGISFKDGEARLYDGTGTPYYWVMKYMGGSGGGGVQGLPMGRPRPEEIPVLDRGNFNDDMIYMQGPDTPIVEPIDITLTMLIDDTRNRAAAYQALVCGTVEGDSWATTKEDSQLTAGGGSSYNTPAFADSSKKTVNLEVLWECGDTDMGIKAMEIYFPPDQITISEGEDGVTLEATGRIYGAISIITSFTAGNESTA